jgi:hypothetical protein
LELRRVAPLLSPVAADPLLRTSTNRLQHELGGVDVSLIPSVPFDEKVRVDVPAPPHRSSRGSRSDP